jgi:hypothetical protein
MQMVPHPPQLLSSLDVSVQSVAEQSVYGDPQLHTPEAQVSFVGQTVPQVLQLFESVARSVQSVGHMSGFVEVHMHLLPVHTAFVTHAFPHVPQLLVSEVVSVHSPLHSISGLPPSPCGQVHVPERQVCPPMHTVPHALQLSLSVWRSTHVCSPVPPQHEPLPQQAPLQQTSPDEHVLPQAPQLFTSEPSVTQTPLQSIWSYGQLGVTMHCLAAVQSKPEGHVPSSAQGNGARDIRSCAQAIATTAMTTIPNENE